MMKRKLRMCIAIIMVLWVFPISAHGANGTISANGIYDIGSYGDNSLITVNGGLMVTLTGDAGTTYNNVRINCSPGVALTLRDVNIDNSGSDNACALAFSGDDTAPNTLTLEGDNTLTSGRNKAGVQVRGDTVLTIGGSGSLTAAGGLHGAGIGGGNDHGGGKITIDGGTITAAGGNDAAGIGGGCRGEAGTITIKDGTVSATGGAYDSVGGGAGIGSGPYGGGGRIIIEGGTVTAVGGGNGQINLGAGIGGGFAVSVGSISISGGTIYATTANSSGWYDIGSGSMGSSNDLELSGAAAVFLEHDTYDETRTTSTLTHFDTASIVGGKLYGVPMPAGWTEAGAFIIPRTLSYDANGGTGAPAPVTQRQGTSGTVDDGSGLSLSVYFNNYVFNGWNTASDGSGTTYAGGSTFTFTDDTTLYAMWKENSTPQPTASPTPKPTPKPTSTPSHTQSPAPSSTPTPTPAPTQVSTQTPDPTATPKPTPAAAETPSPTPQPTPEGEPSPTPGPMEPVGTDTYETGTTAVDFDPAALPEGTAVLRVLVNGGGQDSPIEVVALNEDGVPLGTYAVQGVSLNSQDNGNPLAILVWILSGIIVAGAIGSVLYILWRKGKVFS